NTTSTTERPTPPTRSAPRDELPHPPMSTRKCTKKGGYVEGVQARARMHGGAGCTGGREWAGRGGVGRGRVSGWVCQRVGSSTSLPTKGRSGSGTTTE